MAVTLADVAARAGVSTATVSRVLNTDYPVAAATRSRVERAVWDLDYVVNDHARALLHATSNMVGVVLNDLSDPFFSAIGRGVQKAAASHGRLVVMCDSDGSPVQELAYVQLLRRQRADVVVLVGAAPEAADYRRQMTAQAKGLAGQGSCLVVCGRPAPSRSAPVKVVHVDHAGGSRLLAEHLLALGHRRIAYVTGPDGRTTTTERRQAFLETLSAGGVRIDPRLVVAGDFSRASGYAAARRLLSQRIAFTAVAAANDLMAIGMLRAFRDAGVAVPDDVSVMGFDDIPAAGDLTPQLSTIRIDLGRVGQAAVDLGLGGQNARTETTVGVELVARESAGPPPRRATRLGNNGTSRAASPPGGRADSSTKGNGTRRRGAGSGTASLEPAGRSANQLST